MKEERFMNDWNESQWFEEWLKLARQDEKEKTLV
jgi:hypothetical protein